MHILVTNDDGIMAPGLLALTQAMRSLGKVTVCAPDKNWSASGHVKTLDRPLRVREVNLADGSSALSTDGAPSDCVAMPLMGLVDEKIDLVVAGINPNANIGHDVTYSGTVTAAMEGVITGNIPAMAVSLDMPEYHTGQIDFSTAARVAKDIVKKSMNSGLPGQLLLNINVPYLPYEQLKGFMLTRQGLRIYRDVLEKRLDPRGRPYYWIGGEAPIGKLENGTDYGALKDGYVSITPLQLDLTDLNAMKTMQDWEWVSG
jgi:5'-nucleotidase